MKNHHAFNDIQFLNLVGLNALHAGVLRDAVSACYSFHLSQAQLNCLQNMAAAELAPLVGCLRHVSLFRLRDDFHRLLDSPPSLRPLYATLSDPELMIWNPPLRDRRTANKAASQELS